jgi:hypothetical protein
MIQEQEKLDQEKMEVIAQLEDEINDMKASMKKAQQVSL